MWCHKRDEMKQLLSVILLMASGVFAARSEVKVEWLEGLHDFGAFDEDDGRVSCDFRFVNTGDEDVSIVSARATCGCTVPSYPRRAIAPGDTATVTVTYDPTGRPGRFEKKVYIDLSSEELPRTGLRITGVVIGSSNTLRSRYPEDAGALKLRTKVIPLGDVTMGSAKTTFFEVYNATSDTLRPQWIDVPDYLRISSAKPMIPPGENAAYSVMMVPDAGAQYGLTMDSIGLRAREDDPTVMIDVTAYVKEDFGRLTPGQMQKAPRCVVEPEMVDMGTFKRGDVLSRSVILSNRGASELVIRRVYSLDPGVKVSVSNEKIKKGKKGEIKIEVETSKLPSELLNARIIVITNDPTNPEQIVRVVGLAEE